ncbi:MmgE/PrpD family protein [Rhodovarius lipocyclicus]|uniref:MmgE/PrpD family protein n=1 Tax=Rhodovarius lipocyclicus TaxID=268410 RepID=UPI00135B84FF|nr:MmgE/PrpD family protein [Rhodovarius lipocyclicus]
MTAADTVPVTRIFAEYAAGIRFGALPADVRERTRFLVLDLAGNMLRGRVDAESSAPLLAAARAMGLSGGNHVVLGEASRWTPVGAALLNGAFAHSLDFDDTHAAGTLHPGAPVIPAAFAAGEIVGAKGEDVLAAIVAGYEVTNRLSLALPGGEHYARGFHPTATCGCFGAAVAAARVFGLDAAATEDAIGIALSQSAGSLAFLNNGAWTKRFQVGWASMSGLSAALLAREGFRGAGQALEGKIGFFKAYAPNPTPARAVQDLGTQFELMETAVKPYPSCRYGHASVDAALALRAELGLKPEEIERVTMGLPAAGMRLVGDPIAYKQNPQNVVDGQFSGPFVVANALAYGHFGWDSYEKLQDPTLRALMPKIFTEFDPEIEAEFPANMSGKVTLVARGQTFMKKVVVPKGEPANFLTEAELRQKFHALSDAVLGADQATRLADAILGLESAPDVHAMLRLGVPAQVSRLAGE